MEVNICEAKTKLSQLVARAMGAEVDPAPKRGLGTAAGAIQFTEGWDAQMTADELAAFLK